MPANAVGEPPVRVKGRYLLQSALAAASFGAAFHAVDERTGAACVVKFARPGARSGLDIEFAHLRGLSHPNVVQALDFGCIGDTECREVETPQGALSLQGRPYLVMSRVDGPTLAHAPMAPDVLERTEFLWRVGYHVCHALLYLHGRHLLHGDLTPANVALDPHGRAVLLDFGLAWSQDSPSRNVTGGQGTAGFAAPEALVGSLSPRSDLFGLGACLYWAWTRCTPFGHGGEGVARMLAGKQATPSAQHGPPMPADLEQLIFRLLELSPSRRPSSAHAALQAFVRIGASRGWLGQPVAPGAATEQAALSAALLPLRDLGDPLAGVVVGREVELEVLQRTFADVVESHCPYRAVVLSGLPGSGRRTLLEEAVQRTQLRAFLVHHSLEVATEQELLSTKPVATVADGDPSGVMVLQRAQVLAEAEVRSRANPLLVVLGRADTEMRPAHIQAWLELLAAQPPSRCLFVLRAAAAVTSLPPEVLHVPLEPFGETEVKELLQAAGLAADSDRTGAIIRLSSGSPAVCALLVRQLHAGLQLDLTLSQRSPGEMLGAAFRMLPAETQAQILSVWWELPSSEQGEEARQEAVRSGWLRASQTGRLRVPDGWQEQSLWGACTSIPLAKPVEAAAMDAERRLPVGDPRRAEAMRLLGRIEDAVATWFATAEQHREEGDAVGALWCWDHAQALIEAHLSDRLSAWPPAEVLWRAQAWGAVGAYDAAQAWLGKHVARSTPLDHVALAEVRAWLARRQGDLPAAAALLLEAESACRSATSATAEPGVADEAQARLRARRARLAVSQGHHERALALAQSTHTQASETQLVLLETQALAAAYLGRWKDAHAALEALAPMSTTPAAHARASAIRGLLAQLQQHTTEAATAYHKAMAGFSHCGDLHGVANARLNLAMVLAEQGRLSESLGNFQGAYSELLRLGAFADATAAAFNGGLLLARLGDDEAAAAAEQNVRAAAKRLGAHAAGAWAETLAASRAWQRRQWASAAAFHASAAEQFMACGDSFHAALAHLAGAEAWALAADLGRARAARAAAGEPAEGLRSQFAWADARRFLAGEAGSSAATADILRTQARAERKCLHNPAAFRSSVLAARLLIPHQPEIASALLHQAAQLHKDLKMNTPPDRHEALDADPDAAWLLASTLQQRALLEAASPDAGEREVVSDLAHKLANAQARLRRFVRLSKRLNSELRLPRLLETVLDTVIELTEAERGFVLLRDAQGNLVVRAARNIDETSLEGEGLAFSRSIAEQVAHTGAPVVTVDAAHDERFRQSLSVSHLQLRSVVAVPLTVKGQVEGTIYVDNRLRQGAFTDDDVSTLLDFAELAALALGNARLVSELKRRDRQIASLNRRLESELAERKDEISSMRVQLSESRETFALRFDYRNIIGRSPRMMDLLRMLDRLSDTNLPVLIQGESGTGKELVARALVANGPRKDKAFVTESCAAIPETLLESTLFGYMRGAFTGADRDTRGLFAVAHEGTLFLDEVGEMSPALQGKLLRVLQEGEYRRVGGQRTERTDVRVIAATNKDLQALVRQGQFREDLYFRLAVVRVELPALRERPEDIPHLVRHLLEVWQARAGTKAREVSASALARLCAYRWPGNVRELENELGRATAFADGVIQESDLSLHIAQAGSPRAAGVAKPFANLELKPQVERLEKELVREALTRFAGNQTRAAEALGLSRFGLQKKLRRYGIEC